MIQKVRLLILAGIMILFSGCVKKWLELEPKSEVSADVLFETPEGFSIALNGIYASLSTYTLYGGELSHAFVDVLARCYDLKNNTGYDQLKEYDYVSNLMDQRINSIWANAYTAIANCNSLLEELNKKGPGFFKDHERAMLEGEVLSLRALLHFDLLRMYAPAPVVQDAAAIPYYTKLTHVPMPEKRTSEILQLIIADLTHSKELQKEYDTQVKARQNYQRARFNFDDGFFGIEKRGFRMGFYATTALLSRVALYANNYQLARENAMEVINDKTDADPTISFTSATVIDVGEYDRLLSEDLIFGLYRKGYEKGFNKVTFLLPNTNQIFGSDLNSDYRKRCYLTNNGKQLLKYDTAQEREGKRTVITSLIPMFRLSELYHIAAESLYDTHPDSALTLLNTLRTKRGCTIPLSPFPTKSAFLDAIINDARREFVGEGQLFFLYKRLNKTILDETYGNQTLTGKFVLPVTER